MSKRLAVTLATLSLLVLLIFTAQITFAQRHRARKRISRPAAEHWYTFTDPDGDFALDFPRPPQRDPDEQGQGPSGPIKAYRVTAPGGTHFSVNFQDVHGDPHSPLNDEFASNQEELSVAAARKQGRRVVWVRRLAKNVIEMELWMTVESTGADINYVEHNVMRRGRVYTLACGSLVDGREVDKATCRRFFNSLRFLR